MKKKKIILALCLSTCMGFAQILTDVAGNGTMGSSGFTGNGGPAISAQLYGSYGVALDNWGNVFICDNSACVIRRVDAVTGIITTIAGNGTMGYGGDGGPASADIFNRPSYLCFDKSGNLYVSDAENNLVRKITANGSGQITSSCIINPVAGSGAYIIITGPNSCGDGGLALNASVGKPQGIAVDNWGNLFIADRYNAIRRVDAISGIITTVAGDPNHYAANNTGNGGQAIQATLGDQEGITIDSHGNLYIVDSYFSVVRKVTANGSGQITPTCIISAVAGDGTDCCFAGDNGPATSARMQFPAGVAVDANGNVYIADFENVRIRRVDAITHIITTVAGNGQYYASPNYFSSTAGMSPTSSAIQPVQLTFDPCGNLYFADLSSATIGKITFGTTPIFSPSITSITPVCIGSNITATGHYAGTIVPDSYSWDIQACNSSGTPIGGYNSGVISGTGDPNNVVFTFPNTSNITCSNYYLITFKVAKNCPTPITATATKIIYLNCNPVPVISGNTNICSGSSTTLCQNYSPSSNCTISWNVGKPRLATQCITESPTATTTYSVTVTNVTTGCSGTTGVQVTVSSNIPSFNLADNTSLSSYATINAVANNVPTTTSAGYGYMYILEELNASGAQLWIENNNPCSWWSFPNPTYFDDINNTPTDYPGTATSPGTVNLPTACGTYPQGEFAYGKTYRITLGSWNNACPWAQSSQTIGLPLTGGRQAILNRSESTIMNDPSAPDFSYLLNQQKTSGTTIDNDFNASQVFIYPNPSNGSFTVETLIATPQLLQVFDLAGRMVVNQTLNSKATINATSLMDGVYNVKITDNNSVVNKRVVITR